MRKKILGFSLIELMIGMSVGALVLLAVTKIFSDNLESVYLQTAYARVQENGRMATELLSRDIRRADYWGCVGDMDSVNSLLDSSDADYVAANLPIGDAVTGSHNVTSSAIATINVIDGTDTLTLRSSSSMPGIKVSSPYMSSLSSDITLNVGDGITQGDIVLISDCSQGDIFTNTSSISGTIKHDATDAGIKNSSAELTQTYNGSAQILSPYTSIYFIGENPSGSSSLYRSTDGTASELVRNINDMQLIFGEDSTGNGSVDTFGTADVVTMDNVLSIRVTLSAESGDAVSGTSLERDYQFTTNIRNRTLN